jgi:hypothetical protein
VGVEGIAASVSWLPARPATLKIASPTPAKAIARMTIQNPRGPIRRTLDSMLLNCCCLLFVIWGAQSCPITECEHLKRFVNPKFGCRFSTR